VCGIPWRRAQWIACKMAFDRHQIDTSRRVFLNEIGLAAPNRAEYVPSGWFFLRRMMRGLNPSPADVFVDFGSGMGRVVNLAARRYAFGRVIGVEISPEFTEIARANARRLGGRLRCHEVEFITADAVEFDVPDDVTFAYFYNPFVGEVFCTVLANLCRSLDRNPRRLYILYANPVMADAILHTGRFRLVRASSGIRRDIRNYRTMVFVTQPRD
jgi:SAM-dependent methyltransferase